MKMIVNDLVQTIGYTRNRINHFEFCIYNPYDDEWIIIRNPTLDDYVFLCNRVVQEWMIEDSETLSVIIYMHPKDKEIFKDYL